MPIYVYEPTIYSSDEQVNDCCYFEALQSMSEKPFTQCPTCQHPVHRAVAAFNVSSFSKNIFSEKDKNSKEDSRASTAKNAARLANRHVCGGGCSH